MPAVERVATPPLSAEGDWPTPSMEKAKVPESVPGWPVTVAVNVTLCPTTDGLGTEELIVVALASLGPPPLMVRRIVPLTPTAVQLLPSVQDTPERSLVVPLDCGFQVKPLVVRRMVVAAPTTVLLLLPAEETPEGWVVVEVGCWWWVPPPLGVVEMVP